MVLSPALAIVIALAGTLIDPGPRRIQVRAAGAAANGPFLEKNGIVVIEVESEPPAGEWEKETGQGGYTGSGYYAWRGPNHYASPNGGVISYPVRISSGGDYRVEVRARRDKENREPRNDEENDVWFRVGNGAWTKLFHSTAFGEWGWARTFERGEGEFSPSTVNLPVGDHVLRFAGRSANFKMDRVHLHKGSENPAITTAQSRRAGGRTKPKPRRRGLRVWQTKTITFKGPRAGENDNNPNPFLDYRLQVAFRRGKGRTYWVPGFYDGDGKGSPSGRVWKVRFTPDRPGRWTWKASFRRGDNIATALKRSAGRPTFFNGKKGSFRVGKRNPRAPGFLRWGRLEYTRRHYLKFRNGPYWIKTGAGEPENFLAFEGFDGTIAGHDYDDHIRDWNEGDPQWAGGKGRGIIGALNYLSSIHMNSIYFITMNIGGDGKDTWPFVGQIDRAGNPSNDNRHYDVSKLRQWGTVFAHAQRKGIFLHFVLGEAERKNKVELDNATLGVERKLYYREMVARFGHNLALQWNISEEFDFPEPQLDLGPKRVKAFAGYIKRVDPYDHPITVHNFGRDPDPKWRPFLGDKRFSMTSFQFASSNAGRGQGVEKWRRLSKEAGRPLPISMDELAEVTDDNRAQQRRDILWPNLLSGGSLEYYFEPHLQADAFRQHEQLWKWTWNARKFVQNLPFSRMSPNDGLVTGEATANGPAQVFAQKGRVYAIYLPKAGPTGSINLGGVSGTFTLRWYNPRSGSFEGNARTIQGGQTVALGAAPSTPAEDWAIVIRRKQATGG